MKMESGCLYTKTQACLYYPCYLLRTGWPVILLTHTHTHTHTHTNTYKHKHTHTHTRARKHVIATSHLPLPAVDHKVFYCPPRFRRLSMSRRHFPPSCVAVRVCIIMPLRAISMCRRTTSYVFICEI